MMKFKRFIAVAMAAVMTLSFAGQVMAADGTWVQNSTGWWYKNTDGSWPASDWLLDNDGAWYHFDSNGYMQTGYQTIGSYTYEFNGSGAMIANNVNKDNLDTEYQTAINNKRAAAGVGALTVDSALMQAAAARASEITTKFSHERPNGQNYMTAITAAGASVSEASELILIGDNAPEAIVSVWYGSGYSKPVLLNAGYTKMGYSYVAANGTGYWVLLLAK